MRCYMNRKCVCLWMRCVCLCVQERDFLSPQGEFRVDKSASPALLHSLLYKMSYYRFGEVQVWFCSHDLNCVMLLVWPLTCQMCFSLFSWTSELLRGLTEHVTPRSGTRMSGWSSWRKRSAPNTGSFAFTESKIPRTGWSPTHTHTNTHHPPVRYETVSKNICISRLFRFL